MNNRNIPREFLKASVFVYLGANILFLLGIPFHIKNIAVSLISANRYEDLEFFYGPYFTIQIICLIVAIACTILLTCNYAKTDFPDKYTVITMIYNCIVFLINLSIVHYLNVIGLILPYPVLHLIPVITSVASLIFLFHDYSVKRKQDKGLAILETKPLKMNVKKRSTVKVDEDKVADTIDASKILEDNKEYIEEDFTDSNKESSHEIKETKVPESEKLINDSEKDETKKDPFTELRKIATKTVRKEDRKDKHSFIYDKTGK